MYNPSEVLASINKYVLKLKKIIKDDADFNFFGKKIVSKSKIDDILCCIEGVLPKEFKKYLDIYGFNSLNSYVYLKQVHESIKNRFLLSSSSYLVNVTMFENMIKAFVSSLPSDLNKVSEIME